MGNSLLKLRKILDPLDFTVIFSVNEIISPISAFWG